MVHFVGAGSGAADLITVRGSRLLGEADVIIYAGSLVNPELLQYKKEGCEVYDSAKMTLEEVLDVIEKAEAAGKTTVRLHTGDPCVYGAIREQMDVLEEKGIAYDYCPGVSAFRAEDGVYAAGYFPDRYHHENGRKDTGAGERGDCKAGFSWLHDGYFPEHGNAGEIKRAADRRRLCTEYTGSDCIQGNLAGRGEPYLHR